MLITVPKSFGTGGMQSVVEEQERFRLMRVGFLSLCVGKGKKGACMVHLHAWPTGASVLVVIKDGSHGLIVWT